MQPYPTQETILPYRVKNIIESNVNVVKFLLWRYDKEKRGDGGDSPLDGGPPPHILDNHAFRILLYTKYKVILGSKTTTKNYK